MLDRPKPPSSESHFLAVARTKRRLPNIGLDENWGFAQGKNETQQTTICLVIEPADSEQDTWRRVGICGIETASNGFWGDAIGGEVAIV